MSPAYDANPFEPVCPDRAELWRILVHDDIDAFIRCDWDAHARVFRASGFFGINAMGSADPGQWAASFPTVDAYRKNWVAFAGQSVGRASRETLRQAHFDASRLRKIDIHEDLAFCLKSFDGSVQFDDGTVEKLHWETSYFCRKVEGQWAIIAFVGFMPGLQ